MVKQLENQMINIWRIAKSFSNYYGSPYSVSFSFRSVWHSSERSICMSSPDSSSVPEANKLQKVQCIVLTDGEANHLSRHVEVQRRWEKEPYMGTRQLSGGVTFLRDRKTGNTYQFLWMAWIYSIDD